MPSHIDEALLNDPAPWESTSVESEAEEYYAFLQYYAIPPSEKACEVENEKQTTLEPQVPTEEPPLNVQNSAENIEQNTTKPNSERINDVPISNSSHDIPPVMEPNKQGKKGKRFFKFIAIAAIILSVAVGLFYYTGNMDAEDTQVSLPSPVVTESFSETADTLARAKDFYAAGDYYSSFLELNKCYKLSPEAPISDECDDLLLKIQNAVQQFEPKSGTTFERTFQYQGGCTLRVLAQSTPACVTVRYKDSPQEYVRFYVRKGEPAEINLTGGVYTMSYETGAIWFNDKIGFGMLSEKKDYKEDIILNVVVSGSWVSNDVLEISI